MATKRQIPPETRNLCYQRDNYTCQYVGCDLSRRNGDRMNLHHIQNEQFGGTDEPNNLITLCEIHHKAVHIEFHAFYPDSEGILRKMNRLLEKLISRLKSSVGVDDAYDLKPFLYYLTKSQKFRYGQLQAIRAAMKGQDVLLVTPTGTGKSVCYQLPGMLSSAPTLIISPLKALMIDQTRNLWDKMLPATYINSDLGIEEKNHRYEFVRKNLYKFIFAAPERFFNSGDPQKALLTTKYSYMVIDEAHAIDSWGIAFRPSYQKLGQLRTSLNNPTIIALTATASKETQQVILKSLGMPNAKVIATGFYKKNIEIIKYFCNSSEGKYRTLVNILKQGKILKTLIFVPTLKEGNALTAQLQKDGYDVEFYHGQLENKMKMDIQSRFTSISEPQLNILVSTSAFGMGINIPDIKRTIHWYPALSLSEYVQQIGRAGRDGNSAEAYLLYAPKDAGLLKFLSLRPTKISTFKERHGYTEYDVRQVEDKLQNELEAMLGLSQVAEGKEWEYILNYFGESSPQLSVHIGTILLIILIIAALLLLFLVRSNS